MHPPTVSVIIPCYNEQNTILLLLEAIHRQTYPLDEIEVIIADGLSNDQTRQKIALYRQEHPNLNIRLVDNPRRAIPSALNRALEAASGEFIVRLDAHSIPSPDYIERCIQNLKEGLGDNVGGVWEIRPGAQSWIAQGIAAAAAHPLGVGDAHYRLGSSARQVDTVPFGSFRRSLALQLGKFDESLLTNEDYEFNVRLRQAGYRVWLDPAIRSQYFARSNLKALARQYWRYGYWKAQMLKRYPHTARWRQTLPPAFVASLILLAALAAWLPLAGWGLASVLLLYLLILLGAGAQTAWKRRQIGLLLSLPLAIAIMHLSWGAAFLWGFIRPPSKRQPT